MEVVRYWRFQQSRYTGQGSNLFNYSRSENDPIGTGRIKTTLTGRQFEFGSAGDFVRGMRNQHFNDETIWGFALELALGKGEMEEFLATVNAILVQQENMEMPLPVEESLELVAS